MEPTIYEIAGKYLALYEGLYKEVDPHFKGIIKAPVAASFLKRSNLNNQLLGQIWEIADKGAKGYLDKENFFTALKLIACVQQGRELAMSNLTIDIPAPIIASQAESPSLPAFGSLSQAEISDWIIKSKDQAKYDEIFHTLGPINGKLSGEQVRPVLLNSGLPNEILGRIWELSDIDKDGYLDRDEMCVALHLVYRALESDPVPVALPHNMLPPSKRLPSMTGCRHSLTRKSSGFAGVLRVLPPQASLSRRSRASSVTSMDSVGMPGSETQSPHAAARSLTGTPVPSMPIVKPPSPWIVDKYRWEKTFFGADLDNDGLVNGADVKQIFLQTGLAQAYLAHIWNLCDINSTGCLNLEQFALAMHFVEQKKLQNIEPPAELPPDLLPPSFRPNPAGMTDISTSTMCHETSLAADLHSESSKSGNANIDEIVDDIKNIQQEKRNFEQQLMQLEADMAIENSGIRNLEVELNTLLATVKQLERQKGEAQRRLDDLDEQRNSLNDALNELIKRNEDDLQNINHMKSIIDDSDQVAKENDRVLNEKRTLLQTLTDEEMNLESKLQNDRRILQNLQREQQDSDDFALKADDIVQQLRKQREFLMEKLEKLEQVVANGDQNYLTSNQDLMSMDDEFNLNKIVGYQFMSTSSSINAVIGSVESDHKPQSTFEDPFKSHDPFGNPIHDPFADHDPFALAAPVEDPFASSDPFASQPSNLPGFVELQNDPFASRKVPEMTSPGGARKAPPRPAPPPGAAKPAASPVVNDPFSHHQQQPWPAEQPATTAAAAADPFSSSNSGAGGFGNFADFSKFS